MFKRFWLSSKVLVAAALGLALLASAAAGCHREVARPGAFPAVDTKDCLPDINLTNQDGKQVTLSSLKGKPVLFDFIYTTCPGPCLMLTSRMRLVANRLGSQLGNKVWFVSVTVDPEHDGVAQLKDYAKQQGADKDGWLFLTGAPADVERLMAQFDLQRQREADGTVDHVLEFFLVGPDGKELYQYMGSRTDPTTIAHDVEQAVQTRGLANSGGPSNQVHL